jgi:hypothetical protein
LRRADRMRYVRPVNDGRYTVQIGKALFGSAPGATLGATLKLAFLRALRTFIQGVVAALPAAGVGTGILDASYWETFGYSVIAAAIAALA